MKDYIYINYTEQAKIELTVKNIKRLASHIYTDYKPKLTTKEARKLIEHIKSKFGSYFSYITSELDLSNLIFDWYMENGSDPDIVEQREWGKKNHNGD